jgi:outer membrane protein assembly factor BamE (lipoprotein component of BamABCDE complex)
MKKTLFLSTLIGLFLFVGCATITGPKYLTRDIISQQIIKGKTSKQEVKALLGKPYTTMITDYQMPKIDMSQYKAPDIDISNTMPYETWTYINIKEGIEKEKGRIFPLFGNIYRKTSTLAISFDKNGIVQSYTFTEVQ